MANATSSVSDPAELSGYAVRSYRYLRMAIVVVLLALICSVALERAHASRWEESISAYYYTPVHSLFVGALVALGVCLIAIRGSTDARGRPSQRCRRARAHRRVRADLAAAEPLHEESVMRLTRHSRTSTTISSRSASRSYWRS